MMGKAWHADQKKLEGYSLYACGKQRDFKKSIGTERTQMCGVDDWYHHTMASIVAILHRLTTAFLASQILSLVCYVGM